jgi:hypothetical protein
MSELEPVETIVLGEFTRPEGKGRILRTKTPASGWEYAFQIGDTTWFPDLPVSIRNDVLLFGLCWLGRKFPEEWEQAQTKPPK